MYFVNSLTLEAINMRAPIGLRIRNQRKTLALSQAGLARSIGISPSYLNLIEANKRDVGGSLLQRIAAALELDIEQLTGESEQRLIQDLSETFTDPVLRSSNLDIQDARELVAQSPNVGAAIVRLYRAYADANASLDVYANRLSADPLFSELLHQVLSQITAVRSSSEILQEVDDLSPNEQNRFLTAINRESRAMAEVAQTLIAHFDQTSNTRHAITPARELDDLIIEQGNYFPALEETATVLRARLEAAGGINEAAITAQLQSQFAVKVERGQPPTSNVEGFPNQSHYAAKDKTMWFQGSTVAATRLFQLARLYAELCVPEILNDHINDERLTSPTARRLAFSALSSYLAGAIVLPYAQFLQDAEDNRYDIDFLSQKYTASFEQVAHRLVTLRQSGNEGIPFGFLRSDPAGRLTKHFPLPGLLLPSSGHACPLWAIYGAFRNTGQVVRQVVQFPDRSRYLFIAKTVSKRPTTYNEQPFHASVMLACDVSHAGRTVYSQGLNLTEIAADIPVGPTCRLCVRHACKHRQEEALDPSGGDTIVRAPLVPRRFELGEIT